MSRSPQFGNRRGRQDDRPARTDAAPARAGAPTEASLPQAPAGGSADPPATHFYLPYQFVPVSGKVNGGPVQLTPWEQVAAGQNKEGQPSPTRHDLWLTGPHFHSGRILCRLDLVTPTFVGRQTEPDIKGGSKIAQPYERLPPVNFPVTRAVGRVSAYASISKINSLTGGLRSGSCHGPSRSQENLQEKRLGDRAIPANSLRGMIGAVAEAISQSALRVLEDRHYSVRKPVSQALSSKGTIKHDGSGWFVRMEDAPDGTRIPIPEAVLQTFSRLWVERVLAERTRHGGTKPSKFPKAFEQFRPTERHIEQSDTWHPEPEMPVYVSITESAEGTFEVSELSFSAIWRKEVSGSSFDFFREIGTNLVPWGDVKRDALTPAEVLFGVVEDRPERSLEPGKNLASRLRFFDALPEYKPGQTRISTLGEVVPLRILSSPKPPSPTLYFHPKDPPHSPILKICLNKDKHRPNGRKRYLDHPPAQIEVEWWRSREDGHADQKLCCEPMTKDQTFWFHIDFDNLTDAELTLLRTALEPDLKPDPKPDPTFRHRLGLGKPLGLGSVRLTVQAILTLNRATRYSRAALNETTRYHCVYVPDPKRVPTWPERYRGDLPKPGKHGYPPLSNLPWEPSLIDEHSCAVLARIGSPDALEPGAWVHYPLIAAQLPSRDGNHGPESELKTYAWQVQNEKAKAPAALQPVKPDDLYLPTLPVWMPMDVTGLPTDWSSGKLRDELERLFGHYGYALASVSKPRDSPVTAAVLMTAKDGQKAMAALNQTEFLGHRLTISLAKP